MKTFSSIIKIMRLPHYVKNLFIFMPLFFVGNITQADLFLKTTLAFLSFSFTASAIYIFNDYFDINEDKLHPTKKYRPLAAGILSKSTALAGMLILVMIGLLLMFFVSTKATYVLICYILINTAYSVKLKHIAILDVVVIALGFVLRLFVGSFASNTLLSIWIVIMTFLLALFMALGKRRDDVLLFEETGEKMRKVIDGYNLKFIDAAMTIMASVVVVSYILYTTSSEVINRLNNHHLYLTVIFVIVGILRYLQVVFNEKKSGSPTHIILTDIFIQLTVILWLLSFAWILYQ